MIYHGILSLYFLFSKEFVVSELKNCLFLTLKILLDLALIWEILQPKLGDPTIQTIRLD